ncbi:MAG: hypothetical protein ABIP55_06680 [Tepidisphaeraceae bacterium]
MRNSIVYLVTLIVAAAFCTGGCGPMKKGTPKPAPRPASSATVEQIRAAYTRAYPESRVGVVIAARPQDNLVAVGEVKGTDFRDNQVVTFIDSDQQLLATGSVVRMLDDSIHVRYEKPARGGREPRVGDVMVKTPVGSGTL